MVQIAQKEKNAWHNYKQLKENGVFKEKKINKFCLAIFLGKKF